jgi:hypothetical protein
VTSVACYSDIIISLFLHITNVLPVVLYGCETWSLTLREEHRLRVFENWALRRIFGTKREEVDGGWRRLHDEELHNLHPSPNIIRVIKSRSVGWVEHVAQTTEMRNGYKILVGKPEEKRPLRKQRLRREDRITIGLTETG